jgi:hypothetical protein
MYLVDDGLRESLTHVVRFLGGLVGEEGCEVEGQGLCLCGHVFVGSTVVLWGITEEVARNSRGGRLRPTVRVSW